MQTFAKDITLKRLSEPEDVAAAVNEWITNGGQSKLDDWTAQYRAMP